MRFFCHIRNLLAAGALVSIGTISPSAGAQNRTESACVSCHRSQAESQPQTPMAHGLELPASDPTLQANPKLTVRKGAYTYTVETKGAASTFSVTDGSHTITLPILWSFGQGSKTWVFERGGNWYEGLVSYYPALKGLDTTIGDGALTPQNLEEAVGRKLLPSETKDCFGCHSTGAVHNETFNPAALQPGVTCEHCHQGSNAHLLDALQGQFDTAPPKLKNLSAEDISSFCGQCHRTWEAVVRNHWRGVIDVRFQPYRLANSRCFDGTDPRISCLACHDPHQDLVRQDSTYDSKCLACHGSSSPAVRPASSTSTAAPKSCPVSKSECVSCHMPKIALPGGHVSFTDHEIRVVRAGDAYPN